jgi:hypothetical protein
MIAGGREMRYSPKTVEREWQEYVRDRFRGKGIAMFIVQANTTSNSRIVAIAIAVLLITGAAGGDKGVIGRALGTAGLCMLFTLRIRIKPRPAERATRFPLFRLS